MLYIASNIFYIRRMTRSRRPALAAGLALAAMAVLSPLALYAALPAGAAGAAALLLALVAALDVVAAVALAALLRGGGRMLADVAAALRIAYAAAFTVAIGALLAPADVALFQRIWDVALIVFAFHVALVAVLLWRSPGAPRWLAALVATAAAAYLIDGGLHALAPGSAVSVGGVAVVGELALTVWLLVQGLRRGTRAADSPGSSGAITATEPAA
jgi:hypothetical protein